jgi:hypothetical protein
MRDDLENTVLIGDSSDDDSVSRMVMSLLLNILDADMERAMVVLSMSLALLMGNVKEEFFEQELDKIVKRIRDESVTSRAKLREYAIAKGIKSSEDGETRQ